MKLAIFSDLHLHPFGAFSKLDNNGLNSRLMDGVRTVEAFLHEASEWGCEAVLFGGDWFHTKRVPFEALDLTARLLSTAQAVGLDIHLIPGNHDLFDEMAQYHAVRLMGCAGFQLLNERWLQKDGLQIGGLPYSNKAERVYEALKEFKTSPEILVLHAPMKGAQMAGDIVTLPAEDVLDPDRLFELSPKTQFFIVGHYHSPQYFHGNEWHMCSREQLDGPSILVPGAPMEHTFADAQDDRGWWSYDTGTRTIEFHHLETAPRFWRPTYKEFAQNPEMAYGSFLELQLPASMAPEARDLQTELLKVTAGLRLSVLPPEREEEAARSDIHPAMKPIEILRTYAKLNPPANPRLALGLAEETLRTVTEVQG